MFASFFFAFFPTDFQAKETLLAVYQTYKLWFNLQTYCDHYLILRASLFPTPGSRVGVIARETLGTRLL